MTNKLKNIKAVKEMLGGQHRTQTRHEVGFDDDGYVRREIGDVWEDDNGQKWEQCTGYKMKVGKLSKQRKENRIFPNCNKETCTCTDPGSADLKMKASHGMCLDCVTLMEHDLRITGDYDEYERKRVLENARVWLKNAEIEKDVIISTIKSQFINEDGSIEEWDGLNVDQIEEQIENGFEEFKNGFMKKLEEPENEKTTQ
jgi:hypothetical protein